MILTLWKGDLEALQLLRLVQNQKGGNFPSLALNGATGRMAVANPFRAERFTGVYPQQSGYLLLPNTEFQDFVTSDCIHSVNSRSPNYTKLQSQSLSAMSPPPPREMQIAQIRSIATSILKNDHKKSHCFLQHMLSPTPIQGEIPWIKHDPVRSLALVPDTVPHTLCRCVFSCSLLFFSPGGKEHQRLTPWAQKRRCRSCLHTSLISFAAFDIRFLLHLSHLQPFHPRVGKRAPQNHQVTRPPQEALCLLKVDNSQHCLGTGLGCPRHVVGEWASELNLKSGHIPDGKAKHSPQGHHAPKTGAPQLVEVVEGAELAQQHHEGEEQDTSIDVVVEGQAPDATIHHRQHLLGVDGIERDTQAC